MKCAWAAVCEFIQKTQKKSLSETPALSFPQAQEKLPFWRESADSFSFDKMHISHINLIWPPPLSCWARGSAYLLVPSTTHS